MNFSYENLTKEKLIIELILQKTISETLTEKLLEQEKIHSEYLAKILKNEQELAQLKRMIFGSRSERFVPAVAPEQTTFAFETEIAEAQPAVEQTITYTRNKKEQSKTIPTGRMPLPAHLERVEILIEPTENIAGLKRIGEEITEELEYKPGSLFVNKYIRPKYAKSAEEEGVIIGMLPSRPIEKGIPGPGLLAHILISKYVDHLPLHRQIQQLERLGMKLPASNMSDWASAACHLILPLYELLKAMILKQPYLQADETPIKVLDKNKKGKTHLGYYWVYHDPLTGNVLFEYQQGRGRDGPQEMLKIFNGYLQTDGYAVYDLLENKNILLLGCMAHARRMFDESLNNDKARAEYALQHMQELYAVEREAREASMNHQQRYELRQQKSIPLLQSFEKWMKENILEVPPKSTIGKAIAYSLGRWNKLCIYAQNGMFEIDNNLVENAIRPVAIGRKNYLFAGSHQAAQRAAMIYSLIATCKKNGTQPYEWLKETLTKISDIKVSQLHTLLPGKRIPSPLQN